MSSLFSKLDQDIITFHILPNLDGKTLIILSSVSSQFNNLICKNSEDLWRKICTSTWPSLLTPESNFLSNLVSTLPGGYRIFFSDAFPPIHYSHLNLNTINPPSLPPKSSLRFYYAIDIFLHGQPQSFSSLHGSSWYSNHPLVNGYGFTFGEYYPRVKNFIKVKKQRFEEYLKQNLTFSCVAMETDRIYRAVRLFTPGCKPISVKPTVVPRRIKVVFENLLPSMCNLYTTMVKCRTKVECDWVGNAEDKFCVTSVYATFKDMNGKRVLPKHCAIIILNAILNGERKNK